MDYTIFCSTLFIIAYDTYVKDLMGFNKIIKLPKQMQVYQGFFHFSHTLHIATNHKLSDYFPHTFSFESLESAFFSAFSFRRIPPSHTSRHEPSFFALPHSQTFDIERPSCTKMAQIVHCIIHWTMWAIFTLLVD